VNADGLPDVVIRCSPLTTGYPQTVAPGGASGLIYLNNGTADPFANVTPGEIAGTVADSYAAIAVIADLTGNHTQSLVVANYDRPAYYPLILDQNPVAVADSVATSEGWLT
jgi:hypothetical protein